MLYAFVDSQDQGDSDGTEGPSLKRPKQDVYTKTITQVETIMAKLKVKHGSQYDSERYAFFAHTIQSGKHSSYEDPQISPILDARNPALNCIVKMVLVPHHDLNLLPSASVFLVHA